MAARTIRCGILGARDQDLAVLSALHQQGEVEIAFVYDRDPKVVGVEIAEILGIARYTSPEQLDELECLDFVVVSEPRQRFTTEIEVLSGSGAKLINPADAIKRFGAARMPTPRKEKREPGPPTMDDTLAALERLLDRKELLKFLLDVAVEAASANAGSIMLYSTETEDLYIGYALGLSERVISRTRQRLGSGIAGKVAQKKQARLIRSADFSHMYDEDRERMDIGSAVCVPLFWGNQLLGVLNVSVSKSGRQLDENDLSKLKSLSRRISKVLFQSIKLEEAQLRHQEWRFRSTMGEIASKPITAQQKFTILSGYLAELVGAETVDIFLNTREGDWFVLGGSNRVILPSDKRLRYQRGALSRSFLDNRCIVLTEGIDQSQDPLAGVSSVIYCPLAPRDASGVIALEFAERFRLDEFLLIKDAIILEVSRFLNAELREHKLTRELRVLRDVSTAAPSILGCRSLESLGEALGGLLSPILECERLSVRLRRGLDGGDYAAVRIPASGDDSADLWSDDEERFLSLAAERKIFSTAFLSFEPAVRDEATECRSILAFPLERDGQFLGGVIAYNKNPSDPLEDAIFSEQDRKVVESAAALVLPVLTSLLKKKTAEAGDGRRAYQGVLEDNLRRLIQVGDAEIQRSDRYHHAFTLVLFRVRLLTTLFEDNPERALALVEDITRGLETRTRKTDFGTWIAPDTYAILTLESGNRIRFLVGRVLTYLNKDLAQLEDFSPVDKRILLGSAGYPGSAKTTEDLITEATGNLGSHPQA